MSYNVDHHFEIGSTHTSIPCQDYAYSGKIGLITYGVVLDGCSSAKDTDVGARLIHLAIVNTIKNDYMKDFFNLPYNTIVDSICKNLNNIVRDLNVTIESLNSTILLVLQLENKFRIFVIGDGVVYIKKGNEEHIYNVEYSHNAPCYLAYTLNPDHFENYKRYSENQHITLTKKIITTFQDGTIGEKIESSKADVWERLIIGEEDLDQVSLFTDGFNSFRYSNTHQNKKLVPLTQDEVMKKYCTMTNPNGEFIKRSFQFHSRMNAKNNIEHTDDFSNVTFVKVPENG